MSTELLEPNGLAQELNSDITGERIITEGMPKLARKSAAEGMVLLKNDGVLPLEFKERVAVFGRCQIDTFYVGYGSGGDVHPPYQVSILDGLRESSHIKLNRTVQRAYEKWCFAPENLASPGTEWGKWPYFYPEMPLAEELVEAAAEESETALIVIGRAAGEDRENYLERGSYYLTEEEERMISLVTKKFEKTVLIMNCGNIIDFSFTEKYEFSAILMMWLGGMEAGSALADVLTGKENPSGKLSSTIAKEYTDYPSAANFGDPDVNVYEEDIYVGYRYFETFAKDRVLYSFGYGLSYTTFDIEPLAFKNKEDVCEFTLLVRNTGTVPGKEVIQLYLEAPQGKLGKEAKRLVAFKKTEELLPGKEQEITITVSNEVLASYDDTGKTGQPNTWVMEAGEYWFYFGVSAPSGRLAYRNAGGHDVKIPCIIHKTESACAIQEPMERIIPVKNEETAIAQRELLSPAKSVLADRILENLPEEIPFTGDKGIRFEEVCEGTATMEEFVAQLTDEELQALTRGEGGTNRPSGVAGNTGVYGGFFPALKEKGVPVLVTADGPAGIRVKRYTSLVPCGTALACTFNPVLVEALFEKIADELKRLEVDVLLSPGLNIHRNPLCGRNFEYFSEDPLLSGKMAAASVRGIQSKGASACPKHFAANNQEVRRNKNDSRVSERALREIYLRGFEICVKEGFPKSIMTSYNKINGVWSHYNYDLVTTVLRKDWGYKGMVMTDWWMQKAPSPEFPELRDNAYRVRAQVDVLMPGNDGSSDQYPQGYEPDETLLETIGKENGITRAELQRTAINVLSFAKEIQNAKKKTEE